MSRIASLPAELVEATKARRIAGFDVARALAIGSMIIDHAMQVLGPRYPGKWAANIMDALQGRATGAFIILAGIGISLHGRRYSPAEQRGIMFRRGLLLFVLGMANLAIWPGDILRLFGVGLMLAGLLAALPSRWLLVIAAAFALAPIALHRVIDFDARWDWHTFRYRGLWTPTGMARNLFIDGFRPAIPWLGLMIFGMWLGRCDASRALVRRAMLVAGAVLLVGAETLAVKFDATFMENTSIPPSTLFILSITGSAMIVIALCLMISARWSEARPIESLKRTGQLSLTWYVAHIAVGAAIVVRFGWHWPGSTRLAILIGAGLFAAIVIVSTIWRRWSDRGPMEWLLRAVG
jgi:uncharacterized membrane protein YeiB